MTKRYLLVKLSSLGDVLATTPLFRLLHETEADVRIDHLVMDHCSIISRSNPYVDQQILCPFFPSSSRLSDLRNLAKVVLQLRKKKYDAAFVFHRHWLFQLICRLGGIKRIYGFSSNWAPFLSGSVDYSSEQQRTLQEIRLLEVAGLKTSIPPHLEFYIDWQKVSSEVIGRLPSSFIACSPGGGNPHAPATNRIWPARSYADLFNELEDQVVLLGKGASDVELGREIESLCRHPKRIVNLIDRTNFDETAAIIQKSKAFLGNDSSLMFLASAVGSRAVGLYGPTQEIAAKPLGENVRAVVAKVPCAPCYNPFDGIKGRMYTCGDNVCMKSLTVARVAHELAQVAQHH